MRVEIIRGPARVNLVALQDAGQSAMDEFYRIAREMWKDDTQRFQKLAEDQGLVFTTGVEARAESLKTAIVSIYLDIEDDAKAIYFKLSYEPLIHKE